MAKRYSVAPPSTGTGGAKLLYAGGGRVGGGGIPKAAPSGFSIDLGLDKMRQKTEDDEKRKYLISGGLDPKAVSLMDTQSLDMGVRAMSDDLIRAKEKESDIADAETLGKFFQAVDKAKTGTSGESGVGKGHELPPKYDEPGVGKGTEFDNWFEEIPKDFLSENLPETIVDEADPTAMDDSFFEMPSDEAPEKPVDVLSSLLQGLPPRLVTKEIAGAVRQAKKDVTPVTKEVDPYERSWHAFERSGDGKTTWRITYTKEGNQLGEKIKMPPNVEWKSEKIYENGKPGHMHVDKNNPFNWHEDKKGNRKFIPLPEGAKFRAPSRSIKKNNPKFTAWLMNHKIHKNLLPWNKEDKKSAEKYTVRYEDWLLSPVGSPKEKAALEFSKTASGLEMLLEFVRQDPEDTGGNEFKKESLKRGLGE